MASERLILCRPTATAAAIDRRVCPSCHQSDIWRAANMMIEMFGADASFKAAMRADALLEQGDTDGFFAWKRITRAIDDLSHEKRWRGERAH